MTPSHSNSHNVQQRLDRIFDRNHNLCREDMIYVLELIKKRVADADPHFLELSQPRLLLHFQYFTEVAMQLIHHRALAYDQENQLRRKLLEAVDGIYTPAADRRHL